VEIRLKLRHAEPLSSLPRIPFNLHGGEISTLHTKRADSSVRILNEIIVLDSAREIDARCHIDRINAIKSDVKRKTSLSRREKLTLTRRNATPRE